MINFLRAASLSFFGWLSTSSLRMINFLRVASLSGLLPCMIFQSPWWWLALIPWAILNFLGILCIIPLTALAYGGCVQTDATSAAFDFFLLFALPTIFSISISLVFRS
jgi:hypothetical protein